MEVLLDCAAKEALTCWFSGNIGRSFFFAFHLVTWHCSPLGLTHTPPCLASVPFTSIPSRMPSSTPRDWGGHNGPPGTPTGHPPPATQALGHSTHGACLSTWPFTPCPVPQGGRAVRGAREWQVVGLRARWVWVRGGVLDWGSSFRVLFCVPRRGALDRAGQRRRVSAPRAGGVHGGPVGPGPPASSARV